MTNQIKLTDSPFLFEFQDSYRMHDPKQVYIRRLELIGSYKSMVSDHPYLAKFKSVISDNSGVNSGTITILFCDMPEAIQILNQQHKYIAARVVESAYHIIKKQIEYQNQQYD